jgi:hypothetical protein
MLFVSCHDMEYAVRRPLDLKYPPMWSAVHGLFLVKDLDTFPDDVFLPVPGYPDLEVNKLGQVFCRYRNRIVEPRTDKKGYLRLSVRDPAKNNRANTLMAHRAVALAFYPNPKNKPQVNHKDGVKSNNHAKNLEWATNKENHDHAMENGLVATGIGASKSRFDEEQVREIRRLAGTMGLGALGRKFGVAHQSILKIVMGISYRDVDPEYVPDPDISRRSRLVGLASRPKGVDAHNSGVSADDVRSIRELLKVRSVAEVAKYFKLDYAMVYRIKKRLTYTEIE